MKILYVINTLSRGGAQMMLLKLLLALKERQRGDEHEVISLIAGGELRPTIEALGVRVHTIAMRRGISSPMALWRLRRLMAAACPDLV